MACDTQKLSTVRADHHKSVENENEVNCEQRIHKWLDNCSLSDDLVSESDCCSEITADDNFEEGVVVEGNVCMTDKLIVKNNNNECLSWDGLTSSNNSYKNIQIYKSQNVHIGNVVHIHGSVCVNEFSPTINKNIIINNPAPKAFSVVPRRTWLAQPPLDPDDVKYFTEPRKFVIINHSASEEAYTQTDNNLLVRLIQQFHVESKKWNDISYNFLAGADGSIYEGRGWDAIGAHTLGYNPVSIGICFIGCYIKKLPPSGVLKKVQELIKYGVEIGAIAEDYSLLGHCQCRSSESPGRALFDEVKTWERWDGSIDVFHPSPLIQ